MHFSHENLEARYSNIIFCHNQSLLVVLLKIIDITCNIIGATYGQRILLFDRVDAFSSQIRTQDVRVESVKATSELCQPSHIFVYDYRLKLNFYR